MQGLAGSLAAPKSGPPPTREVIDLTLDDMDVDEVQNRRVRLNYFSSAFYFCDSSWLDAVALTYLSAALLVSSFPGIALSLFHVCPTKPVRSLVGLLSFPNIPVKLLLFVNPFL